MRAGKRCRLGRMISASLAVAGLLMLLLAAPAFADTFDFNLITPNNALSLGGFSPPYVQVDVNRTSASTAIITFTPYTGSGYFLVDGNKADLSVNGAFTLADTGNSGCNSVTETGGGTCKKVTVGAGQNVSGFGDFNLVVDNDSAADHVTALTISLTGGNWLTASDVLTDNGSGNLAAAHIFAGTGDGVTGFVGGVETFLLEATPEPGTLLLVGSALAGVGAWARRRFQSGRKVLASA